MKYYIIGALIGAGVVGVVVLLIVQINKSKALKIKNHVTDKS